MLLAEIEQLEVFCEFPFGLAEFGVQVVGPSLPAFVRSLRESFLHEHPIRDQPPICPFLLAFLIRLVLPPGQDVQMLALPSFPHATPFLKS